MAEKSLQSLLHCNFKSHKMTYIATILRSLRPISCPFSQCPGCFKHVKTSDCHLYLINPDVLYGLILKLFSVQQSRCWFSEWRSRGSKLLMLQGPGSGCQTGHMGGTGEPRVGPSPSAELPPMPSSTVAETTTPSVGDVSCSFQRQCTCGLNMALFGSTEV